ncbi:hypothetical protein CMV_024519, partial [Castanea mollissima]
LCDGVGYTIYTGLDFGETQAGFVIE